jgi:stress-induced morphogen
VKRGMFERVVSSRFKDEGEIQQHVMIIHAMNDIRHTIFDTAL